MNLENLLENKIRELNDHEITNSEHESIYKDIGNEKLRTIFTWLHGGYINLFRNLNQRLPTGMSSAHFWAQPSRNLIFVIEFTIELQNSLKKLSGLFQLINIMIN